MATIAETQPLVSEIVLTERVVTTEYKIIEIHESISDRRVTVSVELGPFTVGPAPQSLRGSSTRRIVIWENEAYDTIRDTWTNADLMLVVNAKLGV